MFLMGASEGRLNAVKRRRGEVNNGGTNADGRNIHPRHIVSKRAKDVKLTDSLFNDVFQRLMSQIDRLVERVFCGKENGQWPLSPHSTGSESSRELQKSQRLPVWQ